MVKFILSLRGFLKRAEDVSYSNAFFNPPLFLESSFRALMISVPRLFRLSGFFYPFETLEAAIRYNL